MATRINTVKVSRNNPMSNFLTGVFYARTSWGEVRDEISEMLRILGASRAVIDWGDHKSLVEAGETNLSSEEKFRLWRISLEFGKPTKVFQYEELIPNPDGWEYDDILITKSRTVAVYEDGTPVNPQWVKGYENPFTLSIDVAEYMYGPAVACEHFPCDSQGRLLELLPTDLRVAANENLSLYKDGRFVRDL